MSNASNQNAETFYKEHNRPLALRVGLEVVEENRKFLDEGKNPNQYHNVVGSIETSFCRILTPCLLLLVLGDKSLITPREIGSSWREVEFMVRVAMADEEVQKALIAGYKEQKEKLKKPSHVSEFFGRKRLTAQLCAHLTGRSILGAVRHIQTQPERMYGIMMTRCAYE